ncbi:hypothetical protein OKW21_006591 [Catalinimonas alkaloidigena]|nr:hypothetical protein [Catalinimonas alkaloidigena]
MIAEKRYLIHFFVDEHLQISNIGRTTRNLYTI